jgi:hypothetical protein
MGHDVFISYSSKDKHTADAVCAVMESEGIRCWIAPRDIRPGTDWGESIIDAINDARTFVLVFSQNANNSTQIKREVERAVNKGIPVIPFRIEEVLPAKSLEYFLSTPHWLDAFSPPIERHIRYLAETIRSLLSNTPRPVPAPVPSRDPMFERRTLWLIAGGGVVLAGIASAYVLAPPAGLVTPTPPAANTALVTPALPPPPDATGAGAARPALPPPQAEARAGQLATGTTPAAPAATMAAAGNFVGKWRSEKVTLNQALLQQFNGLAFGEMLYAAYTGPDVTAQLDVDPTGQATYVVSAQDHGSAADAAGGLTFTSALNGKSAMVQLFPLTPEQTGAMASIGAQPGDSGVVFNMAGRAQMAWFGGILSNNGTGTMRRWHNASTAGPGAPVMTGELDVFSSGRYELRVVQVTKGHFQAQGGQWMFTPPAGIPERGNYQFESRDSATVVSPAGSITWKRVN